MSEGEVLDEETNELLENVPLEAILGVEEDETSTVEILLDAAITPLHCGERWGKAGSYFAPVSKR